MSNSKITKSCKNCAFFAQHYTMERDGLNKTAYGQCRYYYKSEKGIVTKTDVCEYWTLKREPKIIGLERIEFLMYCMAQKLEELSDDLGRVRKKRK